MKYGKTKYGSCWHQLGNEGEPICLLFPLAERPTQPMKIVAQRDGPVDEDICANCLMAMRKKGQRIARAQKTEKKTVARTKRDTYEPRHRFKE